MPSTEITSRLADIYAQLIGSSALWPAVGLAATALVGLLVIALIARLAFGVIARIADAVSSRKRRQTQGYCIGVAPFAGRKGRVASAVLIESLREDLKHFSFGAPYEVVSAPIPRATRTIGMRDIARRWLSRSSAEVMVWGHKDGKSTAPIKLDILSCQGSLTPREAKHSRVQLPANFARGNEAVHRAGVYLIARALQPGLAIATAFRPERLAPVADILTEILANPDSLPDDTQLLLETDYCAMALHIGAEDGIDRVISMRRRRLSRPDVIDTEAQIAARIDLGRALLAKSEKSFDPVRVREAMDHLKIAVELLKLNPTIQLATHTSNAVQAGQRMLQNRQRFSVTGGSSI